MSTINGAGLSVGAPEPTIDSTPTAGSSNAVSSGGVYTALANKTDNAEFASHTSNSTVHVTSSEKSTWNSKVDASALSSYVPKTRTVNGKALSSNITLKASDISDVLSKQSFYYNSCIITMTDTRTGDGTDRVTITYPIDLIDYPYIFMYMASNSPNVIEANNHGWEQDAFVHFVLDSTTRDYYRSDNSKYIKIQSTLHSTTLTHSGMSSTFPNQSGVTYKWAVIGAAPIKS